MVCVPFFFGLREISGLRQWAPPHMRDDFSRFELVAASMWRSSTAVLGYTTDKEVRLSFIINVRGHAGTPLPEGFYGNAFAYSTAATTAGELCGGGLGHTLELVKKAKSAVTYDYLLSVADLMSVDFGWGEAVYGGPAKGGEGPIPGVANYFLWSKNGKGEEGTLVPISLPKNVMERFQLEVAGLRPSSIGALRDNPKINVCVI
ncbi:hypothetical protein VPH35_054853 [Triticum aestivum]|uniref:Uncharacterized protein n=1 Tax=Triticum turgidum subsp. durum TaxID=4567 RepID=A0A9R1QX66_TRITD|nr:unnamed protein product [Triticum turgidum subsp. durum]